MNNILLLQSFVDSLEKIASDRSSEGEREADAAERTARTGRAAMDGFAKERRRLGRNAWINAATPKMFQKKPSGLSGAVDSVSRIVEHAKANSHKSRYDGVGDAARSVSSVARASR
jgi:hypothetical protein